MGATWRGRGKPNNKKGPRDIVDVSWATGVFFFFPIPAPTSAPVLEEACYCGSSQMQELLHGATTTATMTAPPTTAMSNCSRGGNGEQWGWRRWEEGWQTGRGMTIRRGMKVTTTTDDEVEEEDDKDGTRIEKYQAPLQMMDDPAPVPTAVSNCSRGGPQVLQMTLAATTPLTRF